MINTSDSHTGGCLCGAVRYTVNGPLRDVVNCYCTMCQRLHGGIGAHSKARKEHIDIVDDRGLAWFATSDRAKRGFCRQCGSTLFWEPAAQEATGIVAGTLDQPTGLKIIGHIFVGEKADFVEITDDAPQFEGSSNGALPGDSL